MRNALLLLTFLLAVVAVAMSGVLFQPGAWYANLAKPAWTPPNWLFAPVWSTLYLMIAVAGWLATRHGGASAVLASSAALAFWIIQLALNGLWSWLMFGQHRIGLALADIALLWLAICAFIVSAWPQSRAASLLFVPYLAWVSFAGALNFELWRLNP